MACFWVSKKTINKIEKLKRIGFSDCAVKRSSLLFCFSNKNGNFAGGGNEAEAGRKEQTDRKENTASLTSSAREKSLEHGINGDQGSHGYKRS